MRSPLAHGISERADLPVDGAVVAAAAGTVVAVSVVLLGALWHRSRLHGDAAGRPLPRALDRLVSSPVLTALLRLLALAAALLVVAVGLVGPDDSPSNLAPWAFYITFWVGLVPASLLLGPVWRKVNPLRLLHSGLRALTGPAPAEGRLDALGMWPAAVSLLFFAWLELAYPERARPVTVAVFLVVYAVAQLVCALWFGERWFERGDGFEVYSTLIARMSPWGRSPDGRLVLRNPLSNLDGTPEIPGLWAVVVVLVGTTGFDGVTRTRWWQSGPGQAGDAAGGPPTLWLLICVAAVGAAYWLATTASARIARHERGPSAYAHSVIPIAVGYAVAHYFSLLLLDGQRTWILASDPFLTGLDLLGTAVDSVDYAMVSPDTIAAVQVGAVVVGHVLGVVLAHDRAVRLSPERARLAQLPLVLAMVGLTVGGLRLLLG